MNSINRKQIADGVYFSSVQDSRFKTMRITANMIMPLTLETAVKLILILLHLVKR